MHRSATRLARLLACAAVPVTLVAGCSSGSSDSDAGAGTPSASASAAVRYTTLPDACAAIPQDTVKSMVPGSKNLKGTAAGSGEPKDSAGCSWSGLDGYQYRYVDDAFQRFDSIADTETAEDQAKTAYHAAVQAVAKSATGAKSEPLAGVGDEAALITWDTTKDKATYHNTTVVARSGNALVTVDYTGAGLQGDHAPKPGSMETAVQLAAKEALGALR